MKRREINDLEKLKNMPPKCSVCGHYIVYIVCEGIWVCQGCGQIYNDN